MINFPDCYDTENGSVYCDECAPDIEPEYMGQETDTPLHCEACHKPLEHSLTPDGVEYVIDHLLDTINNGFDRVVYDCYNGTWYEGMEHWEIVNDWRKHLRNYSLNNQQGRICQLWDEIADEITATY